MSHLELTHNRYFKAALTAAISAADPGADVGDFLFVIAAGVLGTPVGNSNFSIVFARIAVGSADLTPPLPGQRLVRRLPDSAPGRVVAAAALCLAVRRAAARLNLFGGRGRFAASGCRAPLSYCWPYSARFC
jgi:hypothetical protein